MRTRVIALAVALAALALAASAQAAGYRTNLSKHTIHAMEVKAHLSGTSHGYVGFFAKTNRSAQITLMQSLQIEGIPLSCTSGSATLGTYSLASVEKLLHPSASGQFSYTITFPESQITMHVAGKFSAHGTHVAGTATLASPASEFEFGEGKGCHILTPEMSWSAKANWHKFV
jgi:hypothetical protein